MPTSVSSEILAPAPAASAGPRDPREEYVESLLRQRRARQQSSPEPPEPPPRGIGMMVTGGVLAVPVAGITVLLGVAVRNSAGLFLLFAFLDSKVPARSPASGPQGWLARVGPGSTASATEEPVPDFEHLGPSGAGVFVFAGAFFVTGVTLLSLGGLRFSKWRKWKAGQQPLAPNVGRTAFGTWTPGLALRF